MVGAFLSSLVLLSWAIWFLSYRGLFLKMFIGRRRSIGKRVGDSYCLNGDIGLLQKSIDGNVESRKLMGTFK